jgi:hypothetical protein
LILPKNPHAPLDHSAENGFDLRSEVDRLSDVGVTRSAQQENGGLAVSREQKFEGLMQNLPAGNLVCQRPHLTDKEREAIPP